MVDFDLTYFMTHEAINRYKTLPGPRKPLREVNPITNYHIPVTHQIQLLSDAYLVHDGLKLLDCSEELFESVQDLDLKFTIDELEQPFPVMVFNFKDCKCITTRFKSLYSFMIYKSPRRYQLVVLSITAGDKQPILKDVIFGDTRSRDLETGGLLELGEENKFRKHIWATVALNSLLVYAGLTHGRIVKPTNCSKRAVLERQIQLVQLKQEHEILQILLQNKQHGQQQKREYNQTERTVRPHWRRAHMRFVLSGPGRTIKTLKLIPSVFVNRKLLLGDLTDTQVKFT